VGPGESRLSFAEKLISKPQREKGGETGFERYDYQALWGLALIFEQHGAGDDYAIAFEFHDDILLMDSASEPTVARFYQVKTKNKGHWTLGDLTKRRPKKDNPSERLPSHLGNLFANYIAFPDETASLNFVSNVPCEFLDAATGTHAFSDCSRQEFEKFLTKLQEEHPSATESTATLIHFVRADLSLHDTDAHLKGKLTDFITRVVGEIEYNPDTLYKAIVEECRTKSKFTGVIRSFDDLVRHKSITRAQVESWLDHVRQRQRSPEWADVSQNLALPAMELAEVHREWRRYRPLALNPGDEALNRSREAIRQQIRLNRASALPLTDLINLICGATESAIRSNMNPFMPARLKAMILYEVFSYEPPGEVQASDPPSEDQGS
jgi:hypothetical protein